MKLLNWGWKQDLNQHKETLNNQELIPGRIVKETHHIYEIETENGRFSAQVSGAYHYKALNRSDYPTIGDWVGVKPADRHNSGGHMAQGVIEILLPRSTKLSRKSAGNETEEQILAANIDYVCIVFGLDGGRNFTIRGLERYLAMAWDSSAEPVIILNKTDIALNLEEALIEAQNTSFGTPLLPLSAETKDGFAPLESLLTDNKTAVFVGPSGVGKSSIVNRLLQDEQQLTGGQRQGDRKGRHTTTHKELFRTSSGGLIIDSPGLRELQLWSTEEALADVFQEILVLAESCRFSDCSHENEPGCAVKEALYNGELAEGRYQNYLEMKKELAFLSRKQDQRAALEEKQKWKGIAKFQKALKKQRTTK